MSYNQRILYSVAAAVFIIVVIVALLPQGAIIPEFQPADSPEPPSVVQEVPAPPPAADSANRIVSSPANLPDPPKVFPADSREKIQARVPEPKAITPPPVRRPDTSFVYQLPYAADVSYQVLQRSQGGQTVSDAYLLAFAMPEGTEVLSARSGTVVGIRRNSASRSDNDPADPNSDPLGEITVEHGDSTVALYGHIKTASTRVFVGDSVVVGQPMAQSGSSKGSHIVLEVLMKENDIYRTFPFRVATRSEPTGQILIEGSHYMRPESTVAFPTNAVASIEVVDDRFIQREEFNQFGSITVLVRFEFADSFPLRIEFERPHIESRIQRPIDWHESKLMAWCALRRDDTKYHIGTWRAIAYFGDQEVASVSFLVKRPDSF